MGEFLDQVPQNVQGHIKEITRTSGLPNNEESVEKMAQGWLEKKKVFEEQMNNFKMEEVDSLATDEERGFLAITYSGSIVNVGPKTETGRKVEYTSVGIRADVPPSAEKDDSILANDVKINEAIKFEVGPVKTTSPIFKIAVCQEDLNPEEQIETINNATQILQDEFVKVNKTIILE